MFQEKTCILSTLEWLIYALASAVDCQDLLPGAVLALLVNTVCVVWDTEHRTLRYFQTKPNRQDIRQFLIKTMAGTAKNCQGAMIKTNFS
mmetsp:Transcript_36074/g.64981  ORF Transcript_36074/g.64981 Transcript_36074/m.64981 type:complete len:90 (+) Transcript_36074:316-585(+)